MTGKIDLDPCSNEGSIVGATVAFTGSPNGKCGLTKSWRDHCPAGGLVFVNPPYSRGEIGKWVGKSWFEMKAIVGDTQTTEILRSNAHGWDSLAMLSFAEVVTLRRALEQVERRLGMGEKLDIKRQREITIVEDLIEL